MSNEQIKVLLIEDDPGDADLLQEMLCGGRTRSFDLVCTPRLSAGLERLDGRNVDVVLLDLLLPDSRGYDTFTKVHAQAPNVPIVVLTGLGDEGLARKALQEGAQDYLVKGQVDTTSLVRAMRYAMERKRVEEALRQSQQNYEQLINSIDGIVWEADAQTWRFSFVSKQAERLLGYPIDRWLTEPTFWVDHIHPDDQTWAVACCAEAIKEKRSHEFVYRMIAADGRIVWLRDIVTAIVENDHAIKLLGVMVDMTQRKRVEEALEGLRRQHELILDSAGEGIYGLDREGKTTFVNPAAARMIGWEIEDLIGQPMHAILHHSKPDGTPYPEAECPIYAAFKLGATHRMDTEVFWRKDNTCFPVGYITTPIREHGELVGAVVTFKDLTVERQTERLAILGRVAAGVAHELNNALGVVLATSHLLLKQTDPQSAAYPDLELIEKYAETCGRITQDLRLLGRPLPLKRELVQLSSLIEETLKPLQPTLASRKVQVNVVLDPHLPALSADPRLLSQALLNLITNAVEAMPEGGTLTLAVRLRQKDFVEIAVSDNGVGIAREHLNQIFEPFFTIKPTGDGMGLGLTMTSRIVEDHGGRVEVKSQVGKGSTFKVLLPLFEVLEATSEPLDW